MKESSIQTVRAARAFCEGRAFCARRTCAQKPAKWDILCDMHGGYEGGCDHLSRREIEASIIEASQPTDADIAATVAAMKERQRLAPR